MNTISYKFTGFAVCFSDIMVSLFFSASVFLSTLHLLGRRIKESRKRPCLRIGIVGWRSIRHEPKKVVQSYYLGLLRKVCSRDKETFLRVID